MLTVGTWNITVAGQGTLADYTDTLTPAGNTGRKLGFMDVTGYGAANEEYLDLGGLSITRKFTMTRTHATDTDAHNWYQVDAFAFVGVNQITLSHKDGKAVTTVWLITGAKLEIEVDQPINLSTITHLTITGGAAVKQ